MNAPANFTSTRDRVARLIECLQAYHDKLERDPTGNRPSTQYADLAATEAATLVWPDADGLHEIAANIRHDLHIDEEGFPLDDDGYPMARAERSYIPARAV